MCGMLFLNYIRIYFDIFIQIIQIEPPPVIKAIDEQGQSVDVDLGDIHILKNAVCSVSAYTRPFNISEKCGVGLVLESLFILGHGQVNGRLSVMESPHALRWKDLLSKRSSPSKDQESEHKKSKKK